MKRQQWLETWALLKLKLSLRFLEAQFAPQDVDRDAAWELYVELLTRLTAQELVEAHGDERAAIDSVHSIFPLTRDILKKHWKRCAEFAKIAILVLNQVVRTFKGKWHQLGHFSGFENTSDCRELRCELAELAATLRQYTKALADITGVDDLTDLEDAKSFLRG